MNKAVVLWSGGIDSTGIVLWALKNFYEVFPLFINRHQSNYKWEKKAIESLFSKIIKHFPDLKFNPVREFEIITPPSELKEEFSKSNFKYVYFLRNSDLINNAVRLALCVGAKFVFIGSVVDDLHHVKEFPDNHPDYISFKNMEINKALEIMNEKKINITAPFTEKRWTKNKIINFVQTNFNKINLKLTRSCYQDSENPCGKCRACNVRSELNL